MRLLPLFSKPRNDAGNSRIFKNNLEFLGQNLEFLEIASAFSKPRNDENSRIPYKIP